jgi:hypothetical protein
MAINWMLHLTSSAEAEIKEKDTPAYGIAFMGDWIDCNFAERVEIVLFP